MENLVSNFESSSIGGYGYNANTKTLVVEFKRSGRYTYNNVPSDVYEGLVKAESKGEYVNTRVKNVFGYTRG
jgi:lysyl-tRNA synthetase class 2